MYTWSRYPKGQPNYEVSTKGDRRFSAFVAKLSDGRSIEEAYQLDVKGYRSQGNDWRLGKGNPPLRDITPEQLWSEYKALWRSFFDHRPDLFKEIATQAKDKVITDMFAKTDISQARAICELLNEQYNSNETSG